MNITRENIDDLNAVLKIQVEKADYEEKTEKVLRDYRKKANIRGFRPGMVPIGIIRKMYGRAVKIDEINKTVGESIQKYLTDEKIEILGDPLAHPDENEKIDFDAQESFTFSFDLGLSPEFEIKLSKKNKVICYEIDADEKIKNDYLENYTRRYGRFEKADTSEEKDMLKGRVEALDEDDNPKPEGPAADDTTLSIDIIKDKKIKKLFTGKTQGETVDFDIRKAFPNDHEIAGLLRKQKDDVTGIDGNFRFTINEVSRFHPAEINQELFNRIYGEGVVSSEDEFRKKIDEEINANLKAESDYKLNLDLKKLAIDKTDFLLPEEFLKRWLLKVNDKTTSEQIEKEFDSFRHDLKWQLIRNKVARTNEVKITEEELQKEAENITKAQFRQYGLFYATDEQVTNYAKETLKREEDAKRIADKILEGKVLELLKDMVKIENKAVTIDEFNKLYDQESK
ncbi:MAG: trigger factor [Bacteroidota bacterium]|nr:trigger factor [Bacteroidota bacterium]